MAAAWRCERCDQGFCDSRQCLQQPVCVSAPQEGRCSEKGRGGDMRERVLAATAAHAWVCSSITDVVASSLRSFGCMVWLFKRVISLLGFNLPS